MNRYDVIRLVHREFKLFERHLTIHAASPAMALEGEGDDLAVALVRESAALPGTPWDIYVRDVRLEVPELRHFGAVRYAPGTGTRVVRVFNVLPEDAQVALLGDDYENNPTTVALQKLVNEKIASGGRPAGVVDWVRRHGRTLLEEEA